jgi:hypothetical protein
MSDENDQDVTETPKKPRKWFKRLMIFSLLFMVFFLIIFTVIARMGGDSEPLRLSIEDYISDATGMDASVEKLNGLHFFPVMIIDFQNLSLTQADEQEPAVTVERVRMAASFFDVLWQTGKFKALGLSQLKAAPRTIMEQSVTIDDMSIQVEKQDVNENDDTINASLYTTGTIDSRAFTMTTPLIVYKKGETFKMDTDGRHVITYASGEKAVVSFQDNKLVLDPMTSDNHSVEIEE